MKKVINSTDLSQLGHKNFMNGVSYDINDPIKQLRIMASSCFFGEPSYYDDQNMIMREHRKSDLFNHLEDLMGSCLNIDKNKFQKCKVGSFDRMKASVEGVGSETVLTMQGNMNLDEIKNAIQNAANKIDKRLTISELSSYSTAQIMEAAIYAALDFNPEKTLIEAARLRNEENIRTTPQIIMVIAANHKNVKNTGLIKKYSDQILKRTDEVSVQLNYQLKTFGKPIPNSLKKAWKIFLETRSEYDLAKYKMKNKKTKTIDVINLCHPKSDAIDKLMKGQLNLKEKTWESFISKNGSTKENWIKAISLMGHMALLRNLKNFIKHQIDPELYVDKLVETAEDGKQLPFRYMMAYKIISNITNDKKILNAIENCLESSVKNLPEFKGRTISLCDNSGSAQNARVSSFSQTTVNEIANLTGVLTGKISDDGYVGVFGDRLEVVPISKSRSVLGQTQEVCSLGHNIGQSTENGIWLFFDKAISNKEHWDQIFIYSDMQAGHGELYGDPENYEQYTWNETYIDVAKMICDYRKHVNENVKIFLVQVAGYKDTLTPEFYKDTYILGGWGDGLLRFAKEMSQV